MQHAALAGVHGRETEGLAGVSYVRDSGGGGVAESTRARGLEAVGVEGDAIVVVGLEAEHLGGEVFEGAEELTVAALPANAHELQQLICKKNPQLRLIQLSVFPQVQNLTVLWIERAALTDLPPEMFTLTKVARDCSAVG